MHAIKVLHTLLRRSAPSIHSTRLTVFLAAIESITKGANARVTSIGRGFYGRTYLKHKIKRADRLLSNQHLYNERRFIYAAITRRLLCGISRPIILIDWSPLCADQSQQLLRAALPVGGRSLTLYEEVHPRSKLGNRKIQHQFMDQLSSMVPMECCPIVVADSGFKTPFYRYIEQHLNWHWLGRIRGQDKICWNATSSLWVGAKSLYSKATSKAKRLGAIQWTQSNSLSAFVVLVRLPKKHRKSLTYTGQNRRSKRSRVHAHRENEPWLLVASNTLSHCPSKTLVSIYKTRMQIEQGFRDSKSVHYGLCLSQNIGMNKRRRSILCLLAACAIFVLWCIGVVAQDRPEIRTIRVNSSSQRSPYSTVFIARLVIAYCSLSMTSKQISEAINNIAVYVDDILRQ